MSEHSAAVFCPILVLALNRATFELNSFKNAFIREQTRSLNHWKHLSRSNLISEIPASPRFVNKKELAFPLARETPGLKARLCVVDETPSLGLDSGSLRWAGCRFHLWNMVGFLC